MRFLRIESNVVTNAEEWDEDPPAEPGVNYVQSDSFGIGYTFDPATGAFSPPVPAVVVPADVSMRQARLALLAAGLLTNVQNAMNAAPQAYQIEWEYAVSVERHRTVGVDIVGAMAAQLGLTSDQVDALFIAAAAIP